jgi:hypothetical protein
VRAAVVLVTAAIMMTAAVMMTVVSVPLMRIEFDASHSFTSPCLVRLRSLAAQMIERGNPSVPRMKTYLVSWRLSANTAAIRGRSKVIDGRIRDAGLMLRAMS